MNHVGKYPMFIDWKNQYCENCSTNPVSLHIQCNPYQVANGMSYRTRKKFLKLVWRHNRHQKAKAILSKKKRANGIKLPDFRL